MCPFRRSRGSLPKGWEPNDVSCPATQLLVKTTVPHFITGDHVEVTVMARDTRVKRSRSYRQRLRRKKNASIRGEITGFSLPSWKRLQVELRNSTCYRWHLTLTFARDMRQIRSFYLAGWRGQRVLTATLEQGVEERSQRVDEPYAKGA